MRIISVDDEELIVDYIKKLLRQLEPEAEIIGFTESEDVFDYLAKYPADVALLDIEMGEFSGLELAKRCKELCPELNIIFVTGYSQYSMDAFKLHASGYLLKPIRSADLRIELDNLRHPVSSKFTHRVKIQTFGHFEIFVDKKPLYIPVAKCRECLAYLVDRKGARITTADLAAVLWEDEPYSKRVQNNTHRIISDTMRYLKEAGIEDIVIKMRGEMAINREMVDCDYYKFLQGDILQINSFQGEYMTNYSWAEFTLGLLAEKTNLY